MLSAMTMARMAMWRPAIKNTPLRILRQQQQRVSSCQHITDQGGGGTRGPRCLYNNGNTILTKRSSLDQSKEKVSFLTQWRCDDVETMTTFFVVFVFSLSKEQNTKQGQNILSLSLSLSHTHTHTHTRTSIFTLLRFGPAKGWCFQNK